ncbi:Uncharacterised protein [Segatella copri]|nr:Uncharacterised protein [Segatella copri]
MGEESLPLLAAILYFDKEAYSSEEAQKLALKFKKLPVNTLRAIALAKIADEVGLPLEIVKKII